MSVVVRESIQGSSDKHRAWVLLAAGLTGCAAHQAKVFDAELKPFVDKNLTAITKYIGYPDTMLDVLGKTVYTWGIDVKVCKLLDHDGSRRRPQGSPHRLGRIFKWRRPGLRMAAGINPL